jgi:LysR family transcriptional regulator for metE and metH
MLQAIAETGSVTRAATQLGLTQSAVSHRIREAERRLGAALFIRVGKRLFMTPAGERLHNAAGRVIEEISQAEEEVRLLSANARRIVRMGQGTYSRFHWLPEFLRYFAEVAPDIEVDLIARATRQPISVLQEGAIDLAIVCGARQSLAQLRWFHLFRDPLVAIMAPDHPLAAKPYVVAEDLADERYITYSMTSEPGFEWESVLRPANIFPRRLSIVQLPEAIIDLVRAGFGISILSRWAVEPEVKNGTLVAKPVTESGLPLDCWAVVRLSDGEDSPGRRLAAALAAWNKRDQRGLAALGFKGVAV